MLSDSKVKNAKPKDKTYLLRDDDGLYLRVDPSGRKYFGLCVSKREAKLTKFHSAFIPKFRSKTLESSVMSFKQHVHGVN